jgi:hypothetical protein
VGERREIHRGFGSGARVGVAAAVTLGARCPA